MPSLDPSYGESSSRGNPTTNGQDEITFPPVMRDHILNCSYDKWFPKYRSSCIKSKVIPLPADFVSYLREDGIILADDDQTGTTDADDEWQSTTATQSPQSRAEDDSDSESDAPEPIPPNRRFPDLHNTIVEAIRDLGGSVVPKLNWSTPKDATWISPFNTMKCTMANDIYLLLKSSSFVSHDLEHPFEGCVSPPSTASAASSEKPPFDPVLVLRPHFPIQPSLEFRCFVKQRTLVGISQRDINYYEFLPKLAPLITSRIRAFFDDKLRDTFPDPSFVFDVYIPEDHDEEDEGSLGRVRLVDINPWAPRTDSLLFGWDELLEARVPPPMLGSVTREAELPSDLSSAGETTDDDDAAAEGGFVPELRLIEKDDPQAYNFASSQYSAHKLPKEVVDASLAGEGGLAEFARQWNEATGGQLADMWKPRR